jgi:hypothetical protein
LLCRNEPTNFRLPRTDKASFSRNCSTTIDYRSDSLLRVPGYNNHNKLAKEHLDTFLLFWRNEWFWCSRQLTLLCQNGPTNFRLPKTDKASFSHNCSTTIDYRSDSLLRVAGYK